MIYLLINEKVEGYQSIIGIWDNYKDLLMAIDSANHERNLHMVEVMIIEPAPFRYWQDTVYFRANGSDDVHEMVADVADVLIKLLKEIWAGNVERQLCKGTT